MIGGPGNDRLDGGSGHWSDNVVYGSAAESAIHADLSKGFATGEGHDRLIGIEAVWGSWHDDVLIGDDGENGLHGDYGDDRTYGRGGDDDLEDYGGRDADIISGGPGDDRVAGGGGNDLLRAGKGDDVIDPQIDDDVVRGGGGFDTAFYSSFGPVTASLARGTATVRRPKAFGGTDRLVGIEALVGSHYDDKLVGDDGDNEL